MIRLESKGRARALQLLYAWELTGEPALADVATGLARLTGPEPRVLDRAEALAAGVLAALPSIDRAAALAADNWRLSRIATVERNIIRLAIHELQRADPGAPPKVVIDEAVRLARWFGGARAPAFVNGVLDRVARELGVL
jgi:N utilization substance protein B